MSPNALSGRGNSSRTRRAHCDTRTVTTAARTATAVDEGRDLDRGGRGIVIATTGGRLSSVPALPDVRDERGELRRRGDREHDVDERVGVVRGREDQADLRSDGDRQEQTEPHLPPADEVRDPEREERVEQRRERVRADERRRPRVLLADD